MLVLSAIQFHIVRKVYRLKTGEFDFQYRKMVQDGTAALNLDFGRNGFDSVYILLDNYAYFFISQLDTMTGPEDRVNMRKMVERQFVQLISENEYLTPFLKYYLTTNDVDSGIYTGIRILELSLLGATHEYIICDGLLQNNDDEAESSDLYKGASYVNTYRAEGDFYSIRYEYWVDFTHKKRIVLRDMTGILVLSVLSILAVGVIFAFTLLNLIRQKKLSDLKSDFIGHITHELKTPLTTIAVAAQSISNETFLKDEKKVLELSGIIARQNKYLSHLINNVLDISFWDKQGLVMNKKPAHLGTFMAEYLKAYCLKLRDQHASIDSTLSFNNEYATIDAAQMSTVLNNLLDNAIKFAGETPVIMVESNVADHHWIIKIIDNGCGIRKEDQKSIFEKFYRGQSTHVKKTRGLGLGLFNARRIVEEHGGTIGVESEPGKGSTFIIQIPLE